MSCKQQLICITFCYGNKRLQVFLKFPKATHMICMLQLQHLPWPLAHHWSAFWISSKKNLYFTFDRLVFPVQVNLAVSISSMEKKIHYFFYNYLENNTLNKVNADLLHVKKIFSHKSSISIFCSRFSLDQLVIRIGVQICSIFLFRVFFKTQHSQIYTVNLHSNVLHV